MELNHLLQLLPLPCSPLHYPGLDAPTCGRERSSACHPSLAPEPWTGRVPFRRQESNLRPPPNHGGALVPRATPAYETGSRPPLETAFHISERGPFAKGYPLFSGWSIVWNDLDERAVLGKVWRMCGIYARGKFFSPPVFPGGVVGQPISPDPSGLTHSGISHRIPPSLPAFRLAAPVKSLSKTLHTVLPQRLPQTCNLSRRSQPPRSPPSSAAGPPPPGLTGTPPARPRRQS